MPAAVTRLIERYRYRGYHRIADFRQVRPRAIHRGTSLLVADHFAVFFVNPEGSRA